MKLQSDPAPAVEVINVPLCEANKIVLRPGRLYRFRPIEGCAECVRLAALYPDEPGARPVKSSEYSSVDSDLREALDYIIGETRWATSFPTQCLARIRAVCNALKRGEPLPFKPRDQAYHE